MKKLIFAALMMAFTGTTFGQVVDVEGGSVGGTTAGALLTHDNLDAGGAHSWIPFYGDGGVYLTGNTRYGAANFTFRTWTPGTPGTYSNRFTVSGINGNTRLFGYEPTLTLQNEWVNDPLGNQPKVEFHNGSEAVWSINGQVAGDEIFTLKKRSQSVLTVKHDNSVGTGVGIVGIGTGTLPFQTTTSGDHYRLFVKGGIKTEEIKVELASTHGWADYVFAEDYQLLSLPEVEQHIQETGHLHNIQSAAEIEKEGLELKSMTINQQEKIEELYLHMIEMDKRMKALEQENAALKRTINK